MNQDQYNDMINDLVYQVTREAEEQAKLMIEALKDNLVIVFDEHLKHLMTE